MSGGYFDHDQWLLSDLAERVSSIKYESDPPPKEVMDLLEDLANRLRICRHQIDLVDKWKCDDTSMETMVKYWDDYHTMLKYWEDLEKNS